MRLDERGHTAEFRVMQYQYAVMVPQIAGMSDFQIKQQRLFAKDQLDVEGYSNELVNKRMKAMKIAKCVEDGYTVVFADRTKPKALYDDINEYLRDLVRQSEIDVNYKVKNVDEITMLNNLSIYLHRTVLKLTAAEPFDEWKAMVTGGFGFANASDAINKSTHVEVVDQITGFEESKAAELGVEMEMVAPTPAEGESPFSGLRGRAFANGNR